MLNVLEVVIQKKLKIKPEFTSSARINISSSKNIFEVKSKITALVKSSLAIVSHFIVFQYSSHVKSQ